ncbi:MAG TPA: hypothetical protein VN512_13000 [Clostridia bacterium]|nr:hypothetical protein [Clostridia bacterium]
MKPIKDMTEKEILRQQLELLAERGADASNEQLVQLTYPIVTVALELLRMNKAIDESDKVLLPVSADHNP